MSKLIDMAVNNRLLILMLLIGSVLYAIFVVPKLNLDAFPDVTNVQVQINTEAQGLASEEVEQIITYPIEAVMYSLPEQWCSKKGCSSLGGNTKSWTQYIRTWASVPVYY